MWCNRPEPIPHRDDNLICPIRAEEVDYLRSLEVQDKVGPSRLADHLQGEAGDIHLDRFEEGRIGSDGCRLADAYGQKMGQGAGDNMKSMPKRIQSDSKLVRNDHLTFKLTERARVTKSQINTAHVPLFHKLVQTSRMSFLQYLVITNDETYCYWPRL